jgi:dihydroflavonol-4-reductase
MVVITGASGLLGNIIAQTFAERNVHVTGLYHQTTPPTSHPLINWVKGDITDSPSLLKIFVGSTCVVHAAAIVSFTQKHKAKMLAVNVEGTANVVNACLTSGVKRLIHISSVAAIGKPSNQVIITEKTAWAHESKPSNYGQSKYLAELEVFRGEAEGLSVAAVNPSIILSATNHHRSSGKIIQYVRDERPFYVDGYLNYVDARDVAEVVWQLYKNEKATGRYIANAGTVSWQELFQGIGNRLGKKPPAIKVSSLFARVAAAIEWLRSSLSGSEPLITKETAKIARQSITYSNERAKNELGIQFRTLNETLDWCCKSGVAPAQREV